MPEGKSDPMKPRLTHVFDTLCGWCFVAHDEVRKLVLDLPEGIEVRHLHRRLFVGAHEMDITDGMLSMVRRVGQEVGPEKTGARISDAHIDMLSRPGTRYNSDLTARAFAVAETLAPDAAYGFAVAMQKAIFETGVDFNDPQALASVFQEVTGIDAETFLSGLTGKAAAGQAQTTAKAAQQVMAAVASNGVPCLVLSIGHRHVQLDPYDARAARRQIDTALAQPATA